VDEFDVFMDTVNRGIALKALVMGALELMPKRQFMFLTPLDKAYVISFFEFASLSHIFV